MKRNHQCRPATLALLAIFCLLPAPLLSAEVLEVEVRLEVKIAMQDGVELSANLFLPKAEGPFPVVLVRTPYGKGGEKHSEGRFFASRGYAYLIQDCRGRGTSQGEWVPFLNEAPDGRDTHKWILDQPWSNGKIGTTGGSYVGFTQWMSAPGAGDYLKAMFPVVPLVDPHGDIAYPGGAFQLSLMMGWGAAVSPSSVVRGWNNDQWMDACRALPLSTWDNAIDCKVQYLRDWIAHPHFDEYWAKGSVRNRWQDISVPIHAVGGWYDIFAKTVLDHVNAVKTTSRSPLARSHQHVVIGPWVHGISRDGKVGDLDFGKTAVFDMRAVQAEWFDHWLKGDRTTVEDWPPIKTFVMGRNQWRDEQEWPLDRTQYTAYYFHGNGSANTLDGDGTLSKTRPADETPDRFVYDPADPVPTLGGCNLKISPVGPRDQTEAERRQDVLVFTSEALTGDLEVTGPVKVVLHAASTAADTDWTAKLVDVHPGGRPYNICDGIVRARYRESPDRPTLIEPGKTYRYEIDLWVTANVFLTGHKIRVEISSSNFPRFDRNPNTGHPFGADAELRKATQAVYHDADHPSHILLPIIP